MLSYSTASSLHALRQWRRLVPDRAVKLRSTFTLRPAPLGGKIVVRPGRPRRSSAPGQ